MNKTALSIFNQTKKLKKKYDQNVINGQQVIQAVHNLKKVGLTIHMNIDNYLYRNGILNKVTAILAMKNNIKKFSLFKAHKEKFIEELKNIKNSNQIWFENYGNHDSPYHDLVKSHLDTWKITGLLNSLICDLYVGTYNEGSTQDLMKY